MDWPSDSGWGDGSLPALFFAAVRLAGVGAGTMIAIGTAPIIAGLMARFFFGERLFLSWWMATFLAIAGCYLLVFGWGEIGGELNLVGLYCFYAPRLAIPQGIGLRVLCKDRNSFDAAVGMTMTGALFCLPVVMYIGVPWLFTAHGALIVMVLVLSTITPYILFKGVRTYLHREGVYAYVDGALGRLACWLFFYWGRHWILLRLRVCFWSFALFFYWRGAMHFTDDFFVFISKGLITDAK